MWLWWGGFLAVNAWNFLIWNGWNFLLLGWSSPGPQASLLWTWGEWRQVLLKASVCRLSFRGISRVSEILGKPSDSWGHFDWLQMESIAETSMSAVTWRFLGAKAFRGCRGTVVTTGPWREEPLELAMVGMWGHRGRYSSASSTFLGMLQSSEFKQQQEELCATPMCINHPEAQQGSSAAWSLLRAHHERLLEMCIYERRALQEFL